jgi:hypothetical protein
VNFYAAHSSEEQDVANDFYHITRTQLGIFGSGGEATNSKIPTSVSNHTSIEVGVVALIRVD